MPKKIKTRKEKITANLRRETGISPLYTIGHRDQQMRQPSSVATTDYDYLQKDLFKTILFTTVIIALELLLRIKFN